MANKVVSIEIGLRTTKVCEIDYKKKKPHVYHCIQFDTPDNTIEDGYIRDKENFRIRLLDELNKANIKNNKVVFSIASTKIANREIIIPDMKEDKIKNLIMTNASDYFPVDITEYIISYFVLQRFTVNDEKKIRVLVLAAPANLIKNYYSFAKSMNFEIVAIDYIGNSTLQVLKHQVNNTVNIVVQINEQTTLIYILENGILMLQRTVPYGTTAVIDTIIEQQLLGTNNDYEAQKVLESKDATLINERFSTAYEEVAATVVEFDEVALRKRKEKEIITESLRYLVNNILRVLDYYTTKNTDKKIDNMYIIGQGAKLNGIIRLLQNETGLNTKTIDSIDSVVFDRKLDLNSINQSDMIACLGAAFNPVDFVPKEDELREKRKSSLQFARILLFVSLAGSIGMIASSRLNYYSVLSDNKLYKSQLKDLAYINDIYQEHDKVKTERDQVLDLYESTETSGEEMDNLILQLEEKLPSNATLQSFSFSADTIAFNVSVRTKEEAAKLIMQLKEISYLDNVWVASISDTKNENGFSTVSFTVQSNYHLNTDLEEINEAKGNN
ncbi:MAG: type pilus assembly protein PilM [Anaerocolumna sp.]|jgi:type IV pilus assembly protein PilM|nr:type pilus assembly protein PilM [Anaerocolumna sp.]